MLCCISNQIPQEPVVSRTSGCLFERRLIERYIEEHGSCPVTGTPLRKEDLLAVRPAVATSSAAVHGGLGAASVPGLLERLHTEWDGMMLEQFTLRQRLAQMQQELAHALQQYEAACYVIANLQRECDELRKRGPAAAEAEEAGGVPSSVSDAMERQEAQCREERKKRKGQPAQDLAQVRVSHDFSIGSGTASCVCSTADSAYVAGTAESFGVVRYDLAKQRVSAVGRGHTNSVHTLASAVDVLASASTDGTVRVWRSTTEQLQCLHTLRFASGVRAMGRRLIGGQYALCATGSDALALADLDRGAVLLTTDPTTDGGTFGDVEVHPYGTLAAVGTSHGDLSLYDLRQMAEDTKVHVKKADFCQIDFSLDCFSVATTLRDGRVLLWDLRQLEKPLHIIAALEEGGVPAYASFDPATGRYLAIGSGSHLQLRDLTRPEVAVHDLTVEKGLLSGLAWAPNRQHLVSCNVNGIVQVYNTA